MHQCALRLVEGMGERSRPFFTKTSSFLETPLNHQHEQKKLVAEKKVALEGPGIYIIVL